MLGTTNVEYFRMATNATDGYVLTSNANGVATWQDKAGKWSGTDTSIYINNKVGIGTATPVDDLDIEGTFRVNDDFRIDGNIVEFDEALYFVNENLDGGPGAKSVSTSSLFTLTENHKVGIGTTTPACMLEVVGQTYINGTFSIGTNTVPTGCVAAINGKLLATELKIATYQSSEWSDFVFEDGYNLRPLENVKSYIAKNGHLPDVPSSKQIEEEGYEVADMDAILLQKIEELTLYVIEQQKKIESLENKLNQQ